MCIPAVSRQTTEKKKAGEKRGPGPRIFLAKRVNVAFVGGSASCTPLPTGNGEYGDSLFTLSKIFEN
jgi:hypothetical protein